MGHRQEPTQAEAQHRTHSLDRLLNTHKPVTTLHRFSVNRVVRTKPSNRVIRTKTTEQQSRQDKNAIITSCAIVADAVPH
jgi:hypothetical protein